MSPKPRSRRAEELLAEAAWIGALARNLVRDDSAAEDLVQETLLAGLMHPPASDRPLRPWLTRVVRNFALQDWRTQRRRARREEDCARAESLPGAHETLIRAQEQRDLVQVVLDLDEPFRTTLLWHYYERLSLKEIAERSGVPAATVRTNHARGLQRMRAELDRRHGGDRASWAVLLAPLAHGSALGAGSGTGILHGALFMKPAAKLAIAAALVLVCSWTAHRIWTTLRDTNANAQTERTALTGNADRHGVIPPRVTDADDALANGSSGGSRSSDALLRGRVVDVSDGSPVSGCKVRLVSRGLRVSECDASPTGEFALSLPVADDRAVVVVPPDGWREIDDPFEVPSDGLQPAHEHIIHLARIHRARIHGVLVDATTNDLVPECYFELSRSDMRETLRSDESARFASDTELEYGAYEVRVIEENPSSLRGGEFLRFEHSPATDPSGDVRISVLAGPSYRIELAGAHDLDPDACEARISGTGLIRWTPSTRLHAGDEPWVRFPLTTIGLSAPWSLEVRSRDQLWAGSAAVDAGPGHHPGIVVVSMNARGALTGKITDPDGEAVSQTHLWLNAPGADASAPSLAEDDSGGNGRYRLGWLAPGAYVLHVKSEWYAAREVMIDVRPGRESVHDVVLGRPLATAPIRGIVRSQSGRFDSRRLYAHLDDKHGARVASSPVTFEERSGSTVGTFVFDGVPVNEYRVHLPIGHADWAPPVAEVVPPATDLEFVYLDLAPTVDFALEVFDRETKERMDVYTLELRYGDRSSLKSRGINSDKLLHGLPSTRSFQFRISAEGHLPFLGDESSFVLPQGATPLHVELERGWGTHFHVTDHHWNPIGGVRVLVEGECVGTTNADGELEVQRKSRPTKIGFESMGWWCAGGDLDPATGAIQAHDESTIEVWMRPE